VPVLVIFRSGRLRHEDQFVFQIVFPHRYMPFGRSFFSPDLGSRQRLGDGLESWRGFYQSIRPTQMGLSLNIGKGSPSSSVSHTKESHH
jgi:hypothetical protein